MRKPTTPILELQELSEPGCEELRGDHTIIAETGAHLGSDTRTITSGRMRKVPRNAE